MIFIQSTTLCLLIGALSPFIIGRHVLNAFCYLFPGYIRSSLLFSSFSFFLYGFMICFSDMLMFLSLNFCVSVVGF